MNLDNYECDGQMTITEWMQERDYSQVYPIPKLSSKVRDEEGWIDDWHYCDKENPSEVDVYWGIMLYLPTDCYIYGYMAWAKDMWWTWDSYKGQWMHVCSFEKPLAWVQIPLLYRKKDKGLPDKLGLKGII